MWGRPRQGERTGNRTGWIGLLAVVACLGFASSASAATFTVTNTAGDDTPGSLRATLQLAFAAGEGNTVNFAPGVTGTIQLTSSLPQIQTDVTIIGPGANQLTVRGQGTGIPFPYPVFSICAEDPTFGSAAVNISGLTITNGGGSFTQGGGIWIDEESFTPGCRVVLDGVVVTGNTLRNSGVGARTALGGGVFVGTDSELVVVNSTITGNTAEAEVTGGALAATARGGGIFGMPDAENVSVVNSTVTGNTATARTAGTGPTAASGGGIAGATVGIQSATVSSNTVAATGGASQTLRGANISGLVTAPPPPPAVVAAPVLQNTIVSSPTGATNCAGSENAGTPIPMSSAGSNLASDASCSLTHATDFPSTEPQLGVLQDNGGTTPTQLPAETSPVVDEGFSSGLTTDQRGLTRPVQHLLPIQAPVPILVPARVNPNGGDSADIGAVEIQGEAVEPPPEIPILRRIHFSLRFKYIDKHGRNFVTARVFCHSVACVLEGTGRIRILPFKPDRGKGARAAEIQTFDLGPASGSYVHTKGRAIAGTLRFKVDNKTAQAVKKAIIAGARGQVRGDIRVNGTNTFDPDANKRRFRDIKLFARSRGGDR